MVTVAPVAPEAGVNLVIVGTLAVKLVLLVAVPPGVVTLIFPVVAPTGTTTLTDVDESLEITADLPLKVTLVEPERYVPVTVTVVPGVPEVGLNLVIVGTSAEITDTVLSFALVT